MLKILGIADILAGLFILLSLNWSTFIWIFAVYLLIKAILFSIGGINLGSIIDLLGGLFLIISLLLAMPTIIAIILGIALIQKGIFSLF